MWNARTGTPLALLMGHSNAVNGVSFSPDGSLFVTVSSDGTARVWETNTGTARRRAARALRARPRGGRSARTGRPWPPAGADGTARIWDPGPSRASMSSLRRRGQSGPPRSARTAGSCSPLGDDGSARILAADGAILHVLRHPGPVAGGTFSPDGRLALHRRHRRGAARVAHRSRARSSASFPVSRRGARPVSRRRASARRSRCGWNRRDLEHRDLPPADDAEARGRRSQPSRSGPTAGWSRRPVRITPRGCGTLGQARFFARSVVTPMR